VKTTAKLLDRIAVAAPCTTVGLLSADLGLAPKTVFRHLNVLLVSGRIEKIDGFDGLADYYVLSVDECENRKIDREIAKLRGSK
jgi:hypothetical protein